MKFLGLFDPGPNPPSWASFGTIPDWAGPDHLAEALALSESRGFKWLLQLGYAEPPAQPIEAHARAVRERFAEAGVLEHVIALSVGEEWYERWRAGVFTELGLPPDVSWGVSVIRDWLGRQHLAAAHVFGLPIVWITTAANNDIGLPPYQPIPDHTAFVAVDAYVHAGGSFTEHVAPVLAHAEVTTSLPLVLIPQWFRHRGDPLWDGGPSASDIARYFEVLKRPRWVAAIGFTWQNRQNGIVGLEGMPAIRSVVESAIRGQ